MVIEQEAEDLYAKAVEYWNKKEWFEIKPLVERLNAKEYAETASVTDGRREPPFSELKKVVAGLGKRFVVCKDKLVKADFRTIQEAIDSASRYDLIEICDSGPYREKLLVPVEKESLTIRGKEKCWPLIMPATDVQGPVLVVGASGVTIERLVIARPSGPVSKFPCLSVHGERLLLASAIVSDMFVSGECKPKCATV